MMESQEKEDGIAMSSSGASEEGFDEELSVLPCHTKVIVTGSNNTKFVLFGLHDVVKKAVGLGGWHWLVSKSYFSRCDRWMLFQLPKFARSILHAIGTLQTKPSVDPRRLLHLCSLAE
ncbi:hypothetical protein L7F22_027707 [Adiantum nelumboides]|nr:hypothetical protein [Adiantum nelumboides]